MLLSLRYNFLFVHTAKTGGTSVRAALNKYRWRDPYYLPMFFASKISGLLDHKIGVKFPRHSKAVAALEMLPHELYQKLFKFAFVRNPWDLQVSSYHHIKRERPHLLQGYQDFESFLKWKLDPERPYQYHIDKSITRQSDYVTDLRGELIVDFVGRYEKLSQDFAHICDRIGISVPRLPEKRRAKDRDKDYRRYYSDDMREAVAQHFARDIELFNYHFDDFDR